MSSSRQGAALARRDGNATAIAGSIQSMARINTGTMTVGIFAVLFGLVGAYALRAALVTEKPTAPPQPQRVAVPLASIDLPADRKITLGDMVLVPMNQAEILERGYALETLMVNTDQIVGRYLSEPVAQGQPFMTTGLYAEGGFPNPADKLQPGYRAVTVPIDDLSAVGGTTVVGSTIDVLFRATARPANQDTGAQAIPETTVTLLEGVRVLGVERMNPNVNDRPEGVDVRFTNQTLSTSRVRSVTLEVTPEQAKMLKVVEGRGVLSLALRNDQTSFSSPDGLSLEALLGIAPPVDPARVDVFRDGDLTRIQFGDDGLRRADMIYNRTGSAPAAPRPAPDNTTANGDAAAPAARSASTGSTMRMAPNDR